MSDQIVPTEADRGPDVSLLCDSGGAVKIGDYPFPVVHDLGSIRLARDGVRLCWNHDPGMVVGWAERLKVQRCRLIGRGWLRKDMELAANIAGSLAKGEWWECSAYTFASVLEFVGDGQSVRVNNRLVHGPVLVARNARLTEVTITPDRTGADNGCYVVLGASLFDSGCMPDRLPMLREQAALVREKQQAIEGIGTACEVVRVRQEIKRRELWAIQAQKQIEERNVHDSHVRLTLADALEDRRLIPKKAPEPLPYWASGPEAAARAEAERRERRLEEARHRIWAMAGADT
jgi:hypothetical protein